MPFYASEPDDPDTETGEDVSRDDSWDYVSLLWNGVEAQTIQDAFGQLSYREQILLEQRNAICMTCGHVRSLRDRASFEELATMFEGSSASGAERAYGRAIDHLRRLLVDAGMLHVAEIRRTALTKKVSK